VKSYAYGSPIKKTMYDQAGGSNRSHDMAMLFIFMVVMGQKESLQETKKYKSGYQCDPQISRRQVDRFGN
jgi:hypothetical protein